MDGTSFFSRVLAVCSTPHKTCSGFSTLQHAEACIHTLIPSTSPSTWNQTDMQNNNNNYNPGSSVQAKSRGTFLDVVNDTVLAP